MFIALLFITAKSWKEPRGLSTDKWAYPHHEVSVVNDKNKMLTYAAMCMVLESIILSESHTHKAAL